MYDELVSLFMNVTEQTCHYINLQSYIFSF